MKFGHNFWLGGPIDQNQRDWTAFRKIFSGIPHLTIFSALKYAPQLLYLVYLAYLGAYLSAPNMAKWGVPEKILQNALQSRWS